MIVSNRNTYPEGARIVVITLATSQIAADGGRLLEVGAVALDRALPPMVTDTFSGTVQHDAEQLMGELDAKMLDVYANNGLLDVLVEGTGSKLEDVDSSLAKWLDRIGATGEYTTPLISHGVDWTEGWLSVHLPRTLARFGRDRIDVGCLLRAVDVPRRRGNGRALDEANNVARQYGQLFAGVSKIGEARKWASS